MNVDTKRRLEENAEEPHTIVNVVHNEHRCHAFAVKNPLTYPNLNAARNPTSDRHLEEITKFLMKQVELS